MLNLFSEDKFMYHRLRAKQPQKIADLKKMSASQNKAMNKKAYASLLAQRKETADPLNSLSFYFDPKERKRIVHSLINSYFDSHHNPETHNSSFFNSSDPHANMIDLRECETSEGSRRKNYVETDRKLIKPRELMSQTVEIKPSKNGSAMEKGKASLPIIEEKIEAPRPLTEQKKRSLHYQFPDEDSSPLFKPSTSYFSRKQKISQQINHPIDYFFPDNNDSITTINLNDKDSFSPQKSFVSTNRSGITVCSTQTLSKKKCKYYEYDEQPSTNHIVRKYDSENGSFLYKRELKIQKLGARVLWQKSVFDNQLIYPIESFNQTLDKELFYKISKKHADEVVTRIYPNQKIYDELFKNDNEWLRDIIIGVCQQLKRVQSKVINNKIVMSNISRKGEKQIYLLDWSASAVRQKIANLDKQEFVKCTDPTLKEDEEDSSKILKWLCQPEYLAPEIIRGLSKRKIHEEDLWGKIGQSSSASDIWSLGCLVFQILTLIPLNASRRHSIKGRTVSRRGFLNLPQFSYPELERKQKSFSNQALRILKRQTPEIIKITSKNILKALQGMLKFDRSSRLTLDEIITILKG